MNGYGTVLQGLPGRRPVHPARGARAEVEARLKGRFMRTSGPKFMVRRTSLASPQGACGPGILRPDRSTVLFAMNISPGSAAHAA